MVDWANRQDHVTDEFRVIDVGNKEKDAHIYFPEAASLLRCFPEQYYCLPENSGWMFKTNTLVNIGIFVMRIGAAVAGMCASGCQSCRTSCLT